MPAEEIKRLGRATQGVIVVRLRGDEQVSSIALVAESEEPDEPEDIAEEPKPEPISENGKKQ
jgi:hypothetical protein